MCVCEGMGEVGWGSNTENSHRAENSRLTSSHISHFKKKKALPSLSLYIKSQQRTLICLV